MSKEKNFVSAVIYIYNSERRIEYFLNNIIAILEENFEHSEIICVNDFSNDKSEKIIRSCGDHVNTTCISIINMSYYHGLEVAMDAGTDLSIGDYVFQFDNTVLDFSSDDVMNVYRQSLAGNDIVSASPNQKLSISAKIFYHVFDRFSDISYGMTTESFRILSRRVINRISSMNKTIPYRKAVYAHSGLKYLNVKYKPVSDLKIRYDRNEVKYRSKLATETLILFTNVGYNFSKSMTVFMMIISTFTIIYSIFIYLTAHPVAGWTTTILFLSIAFFGLFGILTVIIKYLQLLINLVFKRKQYSFESIEKITK